MRGGGRSSFPKAGFPFRRTEKNLARLHELGEYFLACCSRKNCPPMTLQGVWLADDGDLPPWKGDYHLDLNLQYSYASAFKFNHLEQGECYTDFLLSLRPAAKKFAKDFFGADGYILPGVMDIEGNPMAGWGQYSLSPGNHPWNCLGLDEWLRYTGGEENLQNVYEYLAGSGRALASLLTENEEGFLAFPVSTSPEIGDDSERAFLHPDSNYDNAGLRYLFGRLAELSRTAAPQDEKTWADILRRLPPLAADESGLMVDQFTRYEKSHRHFSHLMSVYPYRITKRETDGELIEKSLLNLETQGFGLWVGFSFAWAAALYAVAGNGEGARYMLRIFEECFVSPNGFHLNGDFKKRGVSSFHYRPFTLEANMLFSAALGEMLLQSDEGKLWLFPAVPESWKQKGVSFSRLRAFGGLEVSAEMKAGKIVRLIVENPSAKEKEIALGLPEGVRKIGLKPGENQIV